MSQKEAAKLAPGAPAPAAPVADTTQSRLPALQQSQELSGEVPGPTGSAAAQAAELSGPPTRWTNAGTDAGSTPADGQPDLNAKPPASAGTGTLAAEQVRKLVEQTGIAGSNESNCKPDAEAMVKALWALDQSVRADVVQTRVGPRNHYHVRVGAIVVDTTYQQFFTEPVGQPVFVGDLPTLKALLVKHQEKLNPKTTAGPDGAQLFEGAFEGASTYVYRDGDALMNWKAPGERPSKRGHVTWTKAEEGMDPEIRQQRRSPASPSKTLPAEKSNADDDDDDVYLDFAKHAPAMRRRYNSWDKDARPDLPPMKTDEAWAAYLEANAKSDATSRVGEATGGIASAGKRRRVLDGKKTDQRTAKVEVQKDKVTLKHERTSIDADGDEAKGSSSIGVDAAGNVIAGVGGSAKKKDGSSHGVSAQASVGEGKLSVDYAGAGKERLVKTDKDLEAKKQATWGVGGGIDLAEDGSLEGADGRAKAGYGGGEVALDVGFVDAIKITGSGPFVVTWTDAVRSGIEAGGKNADMGGKLNHTRTRSEVRTRQFPTRAEAEAYQTQLRSGMRPAQGDLAAGETLRIEAQKETGAGLSGMLPGVSLSAGGSVAVISGWAITLSADGKTLIVRKVDATTAKGNVGADNAILGANVTAARAASRAEVYHIPLAGAGKAEFERLKAAGFKTTPDKTYFVGGEHAVRDARGTGLTVLGGSFKRERTRGEAVEIDDVTGERRHVSDAGGTSGFTGPKVPGTSHQLGPRMSNAQQARFATDKDGKTTGGVDGAVDFSDADGQGQALAEAAGGSAPDASMVRADEEMVPVRTRTDLSDVEFQRAVAAIRAGKVDLFAAAGGGVTTDTQPMLRLQARLNATKSADAERRAVADYLDEVKDEQDGLAQLRTLSGAQTWAVPKGHEDVFWSKGEYARVKGQIAAAITLGESGDAPQARTALQAIKTRAQYVLGKLGDTTGYMTQIPMTVRQQTHTRMVALRSEIDAVFDSLDQGVDSDADSEVQEAQRQTRDARAAGLPSAAGPLVAESNPHLHKMAERRQHLRARRATLRAMWADTKAERTQALHAMKMHTGEHGESASWMGNGLNARSVVGEASAYAKAENHRAAADDAWSLAANMQAQIDANPDAGAGLQEQVAHALLEGQIQNVDDLIDTYRAALVAYKLSADILQGIRARTEKAHPRAFAGYSDTPPEQADVAMPKAFAQSKVPETPTTKAPTLSPQQQLDRHIALDDAKAALDRARAGRTQAHGLGVHVHRTYIHGHATQALWKTRPHFMTAFQKAENALRGHDKSLQTLVAQGLGSKTASLKQSAARLRTLSQNFDADHALFEVAHRAAKVRQ